MLRLLLLCCITAVVAACDPVYRVGARQILSGTEALSPGVMPSQRTAAVDSPVRQLDIPETADCLEEVLGASPNRSQVRRWKVENRLRSRDAGMSFVVADSLLHDGRSHGNLTLRASRDQPPTVELTFGWIGDARNIPLVQQRRLISIATGVLKEMRAKCLPEVSSEIECVADGLGGAPACTAGS